MDDKPAASPKQPLVVKDQRQEEETAALVTEMKTPKTIAVEEVKETPQPKAAPVVPLVSTSTDKKMWVRAYHLHIRSKPTYFSKSLGYLHRGNEVVIQEIVNNSWAKMSEGHWVRLQWLEEQIPVGTPEY